MKVRAGLSKDNDVFFVVWLIRAAVPPRGESSVLGQPQGCSSASPPLSPGRSRAGGGGRRPAPDSAPCPKLFFPSSRHCQLPPWLRDGPQQEEPRQERGPDSARRWRVLPRGERPAGLAETRGAPGLGGVPSKFALSKREDAFQG